MGFDDKAEQAELQQPILKQPENVKQQDTFEEEWATGLCDCCSQPGGGALGCVSLCMPFVQYGILAQNLPEGSICHAGSFGGAAASFLCLDIVAALANCAIWPGINLLPTSALLHMQMRKHLRKKYSIKGSACRDLCTTWWCGPCALAQETREMVVRSARQQQQAVAAGATVAPAPVTLMGNMLMPSPGYAPAPAAHNAGAPAAPATGFPVPPTQVVTVTLEREAAK